MSSTVLATYRPRPVAVPDPPKRLPRESDAEVASEINFVNWTNTKLRDIFERVVRNLSQWDHTTASHPAEVFLNQVVAAAPSTYELGDFEGLLAFYPILVGHEAQFHMFIWGPRFKGRPEVVRATLRDAMDRWKLRRVVTMIPSRNRLAVKAIERLGFIHEGTQRRSVVYPGGEDDGLLYGLLREEL